MATLKDWFTVNEAADELNVSAARVRQFLLSGRIEGTKITGNAWLISSEEVQRFKQLPRHTGKPGHSGYHADE